MESKLSNPFINLLSIGTPKTGKLLIEDIIPGKCAAPPAPAIIIFIPFFSAVLEYEKSLSGV